MYVYVCVCLYIICLYKKDSKAPDNKHHLFDLLADYNKYYEVAAEHIAAHCMERLTDVAVDIHSLDKLMVVDCLRK